MTGLTVQQRVGMRVRAARSAAGMTQEEVGQRIGLVRSSVANLEAGNQDMPISKLAALAAVLQLDLADLIREGDLPASPHKVTIRRVFEVCCDTCGGVVIDVTGDREAARASRDDHIRELAALAGIGAAA